MSEPRPLILASRSPQRSAILTRLGVSFRALPTDVSEIETGPPAAAALENARRKACAAHDPRRAELVLGVDTVVELAGRIYGKPADEPSARATLEALSDQTHTVISALVLLEGGQERSALTHTQVSFRALTPRLIDWYVASGEWRGRAGGYAIQGAGAALVRNVNGDYENVVGLPVATLLDLHPGLL
ncbi:MAG TPA: Maf family protein [Solirubrobacteraceae bacterium]|jgi:septum formation protein